MTLNHNSVILYVSITSLFRDVRLFSPVLVPPCTKAMIIHGLALHANDIESTSDISARPRYWNDFAPSRSFAFYERRQTYFVVAIVLSPNSMNNFSPEISGWERE